MLVIYNHSTSIWIEFHEGSGPIMYLLYQKKESNLQSLNLWNKELEKIYKQAKNELKISWISAENKLNINERMKFFWLTPNQNITCILSSFFRSSEMKSSKNRPMKSPMVDMVVKMSNQRDLVSYLGVSFTICYCKKNKWESVLLQLSAFWFMIAKSYNPTISRKKSYSHQICSFLNLAEISL